MNYSRVFEVFKGYVECAIRCGLDVGDGTREPLENYDLEDLTEEAHRTMFGDVKNFLTSDPELVKVFDMFDASRLWEVGRDFWLTRNGYGSGFWDGDWGHLGDILSETAGAYEETHLYLTDDDKIAEDS